MCFLDERDAVTDGADLETTRRFLAFVATLAGDLMGTFFALAGITSFERYGSFGIKTA